MLYAILCYDSEAAVCAWSKAEDDAVMAQLDRVQDKLRAKGQLGPVARLMPTKTATTVRKGRETMIVDGPFAETKEQLLGFFVVDCETQEEAVQAARELGAASGLTGLGAFEVRPMALYRPGALT